MVESDLNLCQSTKVGLTSIYNWDEIQTYSIINKPMHTLWTINDVTAKNPFEGSSQIKERTRRIFKEPFLVTSSCPQRIF